MQEKLENVLNTKEKKNIILKKEILRFSKNLAMFQTFTGQVSPFAPIGTIPVDTSPKRAKRIIVVIMIFFSE